MKLLRPDRALMAEEALIRAQNGSSMANEITVQAEFEARGYADIRPRENCLTFHAWRAKGRYVKKGEHGCCITTWIPCKAKPGDAPGKVRVFPKKAYVFHESQTLPIAEE